MTTDGPSSVSRTRILLGLLMVFLTGGLSGAAVDRAYVARAATQSTPSVRRRGRSGIEGTDSLRIPSALARLDLTPDQQRSVLAIVAHLRPVTDSLWTELRPKVMAVERQLFQESLCVLTTEQLDRWKSYAIDAGATRAQMDERLNLVSTGTCPGAPRRR
jgi:hypothetical protein